MKTTVACALGILLAVFVEATPCTPSSTALCLSGGRFEAKVTWTDFQGNSGDGQAIPLTPDTGYFWFFTNTNVELVVKVLDGRALNGYFWVFYGALSNVQYRMTVRDSQTGAVQVYDNPSGQFASKGDVAAFSPSGKFAASRGDSPMPAPAGIPVDERRVAPSTKHPQAACAAGPTTLCLNGGRFRVEAAWKDFAGNTGVGHAVGLTGDTGYFWFFGSTNVETVVKVLDGRPLNDHFWVFYGALSNVQYTLTVTDTVTGIVRKYSNPSGLFASVGDVAAFGQPTTFQLIEGAVVKGEISEETALIYKVYAFFGDPKLPQAYVGTHPGEGDHGITVEIADRWSTLSPATQQLLATYLAPPTSAGSWFAGGSTATKGAESALDAWTKIPTTRAVVWYRSADANAETAANNVAAEIENIWTKEKGLMGRDPLPDGNVAVDNGGDGRLDIYVLPSFRDGLTNPDITTAASGAAMLYPPFEWPGPAYILIRASAAATPEGARAVLAHEFFHTIAFSYAIQNRASTYEWLNEATATWMEDYVYPTQINNSEQIYAVLYLIDAYKVALDDPADHGYAEYLFLFYLNHAFSASVNAQIWSNVGGMASWEALRDAVPGGLDAAWPDFALDCWNTPDVDHFKQWDNLSNHLLKELAEPSVTPTSPDGSATLPSRSVDDLAMSYAYFHTDLDTIKRVEIQNQKLAQDSSHAKIQAWIKLADGTTRVEDWTKKDRVVFCRDKASQKITDLLILYTNSDPDPVDEPIVFNEGKLYYDSIGCGYQGTMHVKRHEPDGSADETTDVTATLVHIPGADFGNTVIYAAQRYTVKYQGTKKLNGCTDTIGPVEQTFEAPNVAASIITFDTSTSPPGYSAQAPFFMQATETDVCTYGTTEMTSAAAGLWWDLPPGLFKVKPDGSLAETYVDGSRTYTWSFTPDTGDEGN